MNDNVYNKFVKKVLSEINENSKIIEKVIKTEFEDYGHKIDLEYVKAILENKENILKISELENKKIAVLYNGDIEITVQLLLFALRNNVSMHLFAENSKIINTCFITLIIESMKDSRLENKYIYYNEEYNESSLIEHQKDYDSIIFIGEPFEYGKVKYFIKEDIIYYNYKAYKVYIDKCKFDKEYKELIKYTYMENILIDIYDNKEEFIDDVLEIDRAIIYTNDENEKNIFIQKLKTKEIVFNELPYYEDRFKVNDLMVKLVEKY